MSEHVVAGGMQNGFDIKNQHSLSTRERELVEKRTKLLGTAYKLMYEHPVEFVRAEGVYMYDHDGAQYLDCYNNVVSVGHCNPRVNEAVFKQMSVLNTHTRYLSETILNYSSDLLATFEPDLDNVMYTCTGSEAVDLSLRIAKFYTKGTGVIVTDYAYHGITAQVAAISSSMGSFVPLDRDVRMVRPPYAYRAPPGTDVAQRLADDIEAAILDMQRHGIKFAAFIADSIFSTDGLLPAEIDGERQGFLAPAIEVIHKYGGLYIADEVQPGFGRTGRTTWGYQQHEIVPDLVVMGKPMGNGMPIAAVVAKHHLIEDFGNKARYFNTFGGNPVSIAAAHAVLKEIKDGAQENCRIMGDYILEGFRKLMSRYSSIGDVRGSGMYFAVEFVKSRVGKEPDSDLAKRVVSGLRERRVLLSTTGQHSNCLKIRPLLIFTRENADTLLTQFEDTLNDILDEDSVREQTSDAHNSNIDKDLRSSLEDVSGTVDVATAHKVLKDYYGLEGNIKKLRGERDQNFLVLSDKGAIQDYVLKFLHPSEDLEFSNFQTALMEHIATRAPAIPIQKVIHPARGVDPGHELRVECNHETRTVRLTTYISGELMSTSTQSPAQKLNLGKIAGSVTKALQDFHHLGQNHVLLWDIQHASDLRKYLPELDISPKQLELLTYCINNFENRVKPKYPHLRRGVVHNDYNGDNVVVDASDPTKIVGLLDFGDAVFTQIVNDVAVGAVYQLGIPNTKLLDGAVEFIKGYDSAFPLHDNEIELLFDLMLTRMFVRLVLHNWRAKKFPENKEYCMRNTKATWEHLQQMLDDENASRTVVATFRKSK